MLPKISIFGKTTQETRMDQELREKLLTTIREKQVGRSKKILVIVDSGACDHVMPRRMFERIPVTKGIAAENEIMYVTADGGRIPNLGEQKLTMRVEGRKIVTTFQVADVNKPILSVTKLTEDGNEVKFTRRGGTITDPQTGNKVSFKRFRGVYVLEAEIDTGMSTTARAAESRGAPCGSQTTTHQSGGIEATKATTFRRQGR